jgi:hypothetical protein
MRRSKRQLQKLKMLRQRRWLLSWLLTGVILLCILIYPAARFVAHFYDEAEKQPLVTNPTDR